MNERLKQYLKRPVDIMAGVRMERNRLLSISDWTQIPDVPLDNNKRAEWAAYRQELRDLLSKYDDPEKIVWPNTPQDV